MADGTISPEEYQAAVDAAYTRGYEEGYQQGVDDAGPELEDPEDGRDYDEYLADMGEPAYDVPPEGDELGPPFEFEEPADGPGEEDYE